MKSLSYWCRFVLYTCLYLNMLLPFDSFGQRQTHPIADGTEGETIQHRDSLGMKQKPWNMFNLGFTTLKMGFAFLYEYDGFLQNSIGKTQMDSAKVNLESGFSVRDIRFFFSGQFKTKRTITWKAGIMYDGSLNSWFVRESGVMIAVPELWGHFFIGRTKEGVSMSKVMSGYAVEGMERYMASDAIPILADGVKWMGYLPRPGVFWNMGIYADWLSKGQSFSTYSSQFASRIGWLPIHTPTHNLHIAGNFRYGLPVNDSIRIRSRPEANKAPFFIDSGKFRSSQSVYTGIEIYYNTGSWMFGTEYYWDRFSSPSMGNPIFKGGELMMSYIFTGETRPYSTDAGIYGFVPVKNPVTKGGPGALEGLLRFSIFDLNDGPVRGGEFWKITPMINWYLTDNLRFELAYGFGKLNRFNVTGTTQFVQGRIQFTLR